MDDSKQDGVILRSALFVDFDNIFLGLQEEDDAAATAFASEPGRWVRWVEEEMKRPAGNGIAPSARRLLLRRCYLTPGKFGNRRVSFTRAGFEVVDCPALTTRGKNSSDIRIVMDVLDTLHHSTHFDEFIIMSSDSDFTPVLLRLRSHDRRTTIFAVGNTSGAYQSACDLTIESDHFIEYGLAWRASEPVRQRAPSAEAPVLASVALLERIARRVHDEASVSGTVDPGSLPKIYTEFDEFRRSRNWLGYFGLRPMTTVVVTAHPDLLLTGDEDDWKVVVRPADAAAQAAEPPAPERDGLDTKIGTVVQEMVIRSSEPVPMVSAANVLRRQFPDIDPSSWAGAGTFKNLLLRLKLPNIELSSVPPGFIYAPSRHRAPEPRDILGSRHQDLVPVARLVHQVTRTPYWTPETYARVYKLLATEIDENGYSLTENPKVVRDLVVSEGLEANRDGIAFLLKGLVYSGVNLRKGKGANDPEELARMFRDNILDLCDHAGVDLDEEKREQVARWLGAPG